jgi:membrane protein YdbS with pleckstrin-like domain
MVGPVPREDRLTASRRLKIGFVLLIGLSAGLTTLQANPSILVFSLAVVFGVVVGLVVVAFAFPRGLDFRD